MRTQSEHINAIWHHIFETIYDGKEILRVRARQRMALCRYGRQDYDKLGDTSIVEIERRVKTLNELLRDESMETQAGEMS